MGHILITGPSGSGKSTLAREIAIQTGLPILHLDETEEWKDFEECRGSIAECDRQKAYLAICKILIKKALAMPDKYIIEGQQLLKLPEVPKDHDLIVMNTPKEVTVERRLARSIKKEMIKHGSVSAIFIENKREISEWLYDEAVPDMKRLSASGARTVADVSNEVHPMVQGTSFQDEIDMFFHCKCGATSNECCTCE